jgi:hypothetical protein
LKFIHLAAVFVCIAFAGLGVAFGSPESLLLIVGSLALCLYFFAGLIAPAKWHVADPGNEAADLRFLSRVVLVAVAVRVAASLVLHFVSFRGYPLWEFLGGDEGTFEGNARAFAMWARGDIWILYQSASSSRGEVGYPYLVGAMYTTYGYSKTIPLLVNTVVGAAAIFPVHALAGRFGGREAARRAALLVAFFPSLVLWSSLMVRDSWILLFLAGSFYFADGLRRRLTAKDVAGLVLCLACLVTLRTYIAVVIGCAVAAGMVLGNKSAPRAIFVGVLAMVALIAAIRNGIGATHHLETASLETLALQRRYNAMGPSVAGSLGSDVDISSPTAAVTYLPLGLLYFYFSPFPWQIGSVRQVFALVDLLVWYAIMPSILTGFLWMLRKRTRAVLPLLFTVIGISVLYALVEGNIGIIFRHRAQIIVPLCIVAGVGYARKRRAAAKAKETSEDPFSLDAAAGGPFRPAPDLRLPARA